MVFHDAVFKAGDKLNNIHEEVECQKELRDSTEKVKETLIAHYLYTM